MDYEKVTPKVGDTVVTIMNGNSRRVDAYLVEGKVVKIEDNLISVKTFKTNRTIKRLNYETYVISKGK